MSLDIEDLCNQTVLSVKPGKLIREHLRSSSAGLFIFDQKVDTASSRLFVIGAGKAAFGMAAEVESIVGKWICGGIITTKYGHGGQLEHIEVLESGHPSPDQAGLEAVNKTMQLLQKIRSNDTVICLISGGASALWADIPPWLSLADYQKLTYELLRCGANIQEINTIRKHLALLKGGQLPRFINQANIYTLIISDVPGDQLDVIASGPTVADRSTYREAMDVLKKYDLKGQIPASILNHLEEGIKGALNETPKESDPIFEHVFNKIIGNNTKALETARIYLVEKGFTVETNNKVISGDCESEVMELLDKTLHQSNADMFCYLQGGETTVKHSGDGKGGRNQHFVLYALWKLLTDFSSFAHSKITVFSFGTDGSDGPTDANGAWACNCDPHDEEEVGHFVKSHNSYLFFEKYGGHIKTGPTQTNVMDIMGIIIEKI